MGPQENAASTGDHRLDAENAMKQPFNPADLHRRDPSLK